MQRRVYLVHFRKKREIEFVTIFANNSRFLGEYIFIRKKCFSLECLSVVYVCVPYESQQRVSLELTKRERERESE